MNIKIKSTGNGIKPLCLTITVLFSFAWGFSQNIKNPSFDINDFNRKAAIAEWLCEYDDVAWRTTDSVLVQDSAELVRLGPEWFCFQTKNKLWHAVYGKYENNRYDLVFHYVVDTLNRVSRNYEPVDTSMLFPYSRALITANLQVKPMKDTMDMGFNQFIRRNADSTFTVWIFPSFQSDNYAVYGGEFIYIIDPSGQRIIRNDSYFQGQFRAFKVGKPREVRMDFTELEKPTLGNVFFVWYYKGFFTNIYVENRHFNSTAFKNSDGTWSWMHVENSKP